MHVAYYLSNDRAKKKMGTVFIETYCVKLAIKVDPAKFHIYSTYITLSTYIVYILYNYVTL